MFYKLGLAVLSLTVLILTLGYVSVLWYQKNDERRLAKNYGSHYVKHIKSYRM